MAAPTWNQPAPAQSRGQSRRGCRRSHCGPAHRHRSASSLLICRDSSTSFQRGPINGCRSQPAHRPAPGSALSCHGPAHRRTIRRSGAAPWTASAPPELHPSAPAPCATTGNPRLAATARSPPQMKVGCHPPARLVDPPSIIRRTEQVRFDGAQSIPSSSLASSLIRSGPQGGDQTSLTRTSETPGTARIVASTSPGMLAATGQAGVVRVIST